MNQSKISVRYAKAFFQLMSEKNKLEAVVADAKFLFESIDKIDELKAFVQNPIIKPSKKQATFEALFASKVSAETINFIKLIVTNKREIFLQDILRNFLEQYRKSSGITEVTLTTAQTFTSAQVEGITEYVSKKYNTKVELNEKVDDSLLGGFVLRIEDEQFDASIKTKITQIKQELLSKATR